MNFKEKTASLLSLILCLLCLNLGAQEIQIDNNLRGPDDVAFNPILAPFYHGVASGDPLHDAVIIWTRVTPTNSSPIPVSWEMATDTGFTNVVNSGNLMTDASKDYTVKVDVTGLNAGSTYYYRFNAMSTNSITGRTKTATSGAAQGNLKFGIVSCNNYQSGYFNAFGRLAEANDLNAILHLGDFIYEYATGGYGYTAAVGRGHDPATEIISLADYRTRYSYYRLDDDLRRVMQQHPFILIWDDHEIANDSWEDGAENHDDLTEGLYSDRKNSATQAYFEWAPIRDNTTNQVYRTFDYGDLADLIMLDTRHEERDEQVTDITDPELVNPNRTLLGTTQLSWFENQLTNSDAAWKVVGNQVVFSQLLLAVFEQFVPGAQNLFLDVWDGYPAERTKVMDYITNNNIDDIVFLTGDVHMTFSFDVTPDPEDPLVYDPASGDGSLAVEFVTPSITSDNIDELFGASAASLFAGLFPGANPHSKVNNFVDHGYFILDLTPNKAQADFYYVPTVTSPSTSVNFSTGAYTNLGDNNLQVTTTPAPPKPQQEIPAPDPTLLTTSIHQVDADLVLIGLYPNPMSEIGMLNYALSKRSNISIDIFDIKGQKMMNLFNDEQGVGNYSLTFNPSELTSGTYLLQLSTEQGSSSRKFVVKQ